MIARDCYDLVSAKPVYCKVLVDGKGKASTLDALGGSADFKGICSRNARFVTHLVEKRSNNNSIKSRFNKCV